MKIETISVIPYKYMTNYIKLKNEALKDTKVKEAYDSLEFEFSNFQKSLNNKLKIKEKKI